MIRDGDLSNDSEESGTEDASTDFTEGKDKKFKRKETVQLSLPSDISSHPEISACLDRINLSHGKTTLLLETLAKVINLKSSLSQYICSV